MMDAMKASDLMSRPLVYAHLKDSIRGVAKVFVEKKISGAPVLDDAGAPVGVITKTDLTRYDRERLSILIVEKEPGILVTAGTGESIDPKAGLHLEREEETIEAWMTPRIYSVPEDASLAQVIREMAGRRVHRLFVREKRSEKLIGVVTTMDLLRHLSRRSQGAGKRRSAQKRRMASGRKVAKSDNWRTQK